MLSNLAHEFGDGIPVSFAPSVVELIQVVSAFCWVGLSSHTMQLSALRTSRLKGPRTGEPGGETYSHCCAKLDDDRQGKGGTPEARQRARR